MSANRQTARALAVVAVLAGGLLPAVVLAQAKISGTVTDPDGTPIAGAKVTVRGLLEAHLRFTIETNAKGKYVVENFNPGRGYQFNVVREGFQSLAKNVEIGLSGTVTGSNFRQDFVLYPVGTARQKESQLIIMSRYSPGQDPYKKGLRSLESGDLKKARTRFERARELDPELAPIHEGLALVYHRLGENQEALEAVDKALELAPGDPDYLRIRYDALRGLGRDDEARQTLVGLAEMAADAETAKLFFNDGVEAVRGGAPELAGSMFEAALRLNPEMVEAEDALAKVYLQLKKYESAAVAAEKVLVERPADVVMLRLRHEAFTGLGERARARQALDDLMAHDPGERTATLLYNEGVIAFNAGEDEAAAETFKKAIEMAPRHIQAQIGLAEVYLRQRKFDLCLETVDAILALDANHPDGLRIQKRARARSGDHQ